MSKNTPFPSEKDELRTAHDSNSTIEEMVEEFRGTSCYEIFRRQMENLRTLKTQSHKPRRD